MHTSVLSVGNSIIDLFLQIHDEEKVVSIDESSNTIAFPRGAKILLDKSEPRLGGNAANVAVGLKRLGIQSALMAEIASDEFSEKIIHGLEDEGVDISHIIRSKGQTSLNIGINFHKERTLFTTHQKHDHLFTFDIEADWIYLTSLGDSWKHVYEDVASRVRSKRSRLAFNPGSVQYAAGVTSFSHLLPITDILFVNKEEATAIVGSHAHDLDLVRALVHKGVKTPVLTDGERGAYSIDESGVYFHQPSKK
jgi:sugar/nucleoside kinase (ribokinase family)